MDINVDLDDILWGMSDWEKQEMCDNLCDDGYTPSTQSIDDIKSFFFEVEGRITHNERELLDILIKIWYNKHFINNKDIEQLKIYAKKGL
jgi:hypothetical protein